MVSGVDSAGEQPRELVLDHALQTDHLCESYHRVGCHNTSQQFVHECSVLLLQICRIGFEHFST